MKTIEERLILTSELNTINLLRIIADIMTEEQLKELDRRLDEVIKVNALNTNGQCLENDA